MARIQAYSPHEIYVAPARRRRELWRLIPAALVILFLYVAPLAAFSAGLALSYGPQIADAITRRVVEGGTPGAMLVMLYSFSGLMMGTMAAVRLVHRRGAGTLFGPSARETVGSFLRVIVPLAGLQVVVAAFALNAPAIRPGLSFAAFLGYLPFSLPGIFIQVASEELLFRGYLQQQLAARFASPVVWMGVPSMLFAWGHYLPSEFGPGAVVIVVWALVFGCLAADLTARTGNLGAALAFHAANNMSAMLFIGLEGNLDGLALWSMHVDFNQDLAFSVVMVADFLTMLCAWLLARLALRR